MKISNENLEPCFLKCESCEKETDMATMTADADSNWFCAECWEELEPILQAEYEEMVKNREIEPEND